ncbi:MAG TPA: GWxTD domain-containing protein [Bacteroidales bacterium]|nr:GWxTD domain-containing protein [Bacteroidales bacterium]MDI9572982.1 GWxTD domain-containing protein [Bacteroidota bacterium]OQC58824.1 MAG: hypothetical protein BWX51_01862 [Bacteroidetes bacterium ADurb.Bin012]MBP9512614.1 GWxTD domain-containing protein [Bacteroidales bacterium]MBP9589091.1 GWxTD domain-containing protein [Bacteroidales bacterium]
MKKKRKIKVSVISSILLLILQGSCTSSKLLQNNNFASDMLAGSMKALTGIQVYGANPDSIHLYLEIDPSLLKPQALPDGLEFLSLSLRWMIFSSFSEKSIIDSSTFRTGPLSPHQSEKLIFEHSLKAPRGKSYYLCYKPSSDRYRNWNIMWIDRTNEQSHNHFLITLSDSTLIFRSEELFDKPLYIYHSVPTDNTNLFLRRINLCSCTPSPPFALKVGACKIRFDSIKTIRIHHGKSEEFLLENPGLYFIQIDTNLIGAGSFLVLNPEFRHLLIKASSRYITDNDEFRDIWLGNIGLLDFWENIAGSTQRTIELSKRFSYAVNQSNLLFTRALPGCLTDRGMIYIVFGPPNAIYEDNELETWVYREFRQKRDLIFNFKKEWIFPIGLEYRLDRRAEYTQIWYEAIERWRR